MNKKNIKFFLVGGCQNGLCGITYIENNIDKLRFHNLSKKKGCEMMSNNKSYDEKIQNQFGAFCVKVLKNEMKHIYREMYRHNKNISVNNISLNQCKQISVYDTYFNDGYIFYVYGEKIIVYGNELASAIKRLSPHRRSVILLSFFTDLTDREIAKKMKSAHQNVSKSRKRALIELKEILKTEDY